MLEFYVVRMIKTLFSSISRLIEDSNKRDNWLAARRKTHVFLAKNCGEYHIICRKLQNEGAARL